MSRVMDSSTNLLPDRTFLAVTSASENSDRIAESTPSARPETPK